MTDTPRAQVSAGLAEIDIYPGLEQGLVAGDRLYEGDFTGDAIESEPNGFRNLLDDGTYAAFIFGLDRRQVRRAGILPENVWTTTAAEGAAGYWQPITHGMAHRQLSVLNQTTEMTQCEVRGYPSTIDEYVFKGELRASGTTPPSDAPSEFMSRPNQSKGSGVGTFVAGYYRFVQAHPDYDENGVTFVRDKWAPYGTLYFYDPTNIKKLEWNPFRLLPGFLEQLAGAYYPDSNKDILEARYKGRWNTFVENPAMAAIMRRIQHQFDPVTVD